MHAHTHPPSSLGCSTLRLGSRGSSACATPPRAPTRPPNPCAQSCDDPDVWRPVSRGAGDGRQMYPGDPQRIQARGAMGGRARSSTDDRGAGGLPNWAQGAGNRPVGNSGGSAGPSGRAGSVPRARPAGPPGNAPGGGVGRGGGAGRAYTGGDAVRGGGE
jgi:hypothetical protein